MSYIANERAVQDMERNQPLPRYSLKELHDRVQVIGPVDGVPRPGAFLAALKEELEKIRADLHKEQE